MSIIGAKRFQNGVFEALASQNRSAGSGGGSGIGPTPLITAAGNFNVAITGTTYQAVNTATFSIVRTGIILIWSSALTGNQTAGAGTCTMGVQLDGQFPSGVGGGFSLQGDIGGNFAGQTTIGPFSLVYVWLGVQPGIHTMRVVANTSGAGVTYACSGNATAMMLS